MRHVFKNSAECAHIWASRSQEDGKAGNVNFKGDSIYSYRWWEMARFIEIKGETIVLMRSWSYSGNTSKHMNYVSEALRGLNYRIVYCYGEQTGGYLFYYSGGNLLNHESSLVHWLNAMKESQGKLKRARIPEWQVNANHNARKSIEEYCTLFDLELPKEMLDYYLDPDDIAPLLAAKAKRAKELEVGAEERAEKRREQFIKKNAKKVQEFLTHEERWINGENVSVEFHLNNSKRRYHFDRTNNLEFSQTRLRLKSDVVETSRRAYVSVKEAKVLWALIKDGRDIKGHKIDGYTVISMNGVLKIGCHEIKREEMERFVEKYNW
jgi:hypothetical protein